PKWGLIYVDEKGRAAIKYDCRIKSVRRECENEWGWKTHPEGFYFITQRAEENWFEIDTFSERNIMYSALRRLFKNWHKVTKSAFADGATPRVECLWMNEKVKQNLNRTLFI